MKQIPLIIVLLSIIGCAKEPGLGGNAAIVGKLKLENYNADFSVLKQSYYLNNESVYLIFGDNAAYGDRVRTNFDGSYEFRNLNMGQYTLYAYSKDSTFLSPSGYSPVMKTIEITQQQELVQVEDLVILDNDVKGFASIRGKVLVDDGTNQYYAPDERVYIIYDSSPNVESSQRTNYDGFFEFSGLPVGTYQIYAYTKDDQAPSGVRPIIQNVTIDSINQQLVLPDLVINQ